MSNRKCSAAIRSRSIRISTDNHDDDWKPKVRAWIKLQNRRALDADEYVLLYPEGRVVLNKTSYDILKLCTGENTIEKIISTLCQMYDRPNSIDIDIESEIGKDVTTFIYASKELLWFE